MRFVVLGPLEVLGESGEPLPLSGSKERTILADLVAHAGHVVSVDDPDFGPVTVQGPAPQLTETPGRISHLGRGLGADNEAVFGQLLGLDGERLAALQSAGVL